MQSFGQPGGGGGLAIGNLYDERLALMDIVNDRSLQIRTFILKKGKVYQETFLYQKFLEGNGKMRISRQLYGFGLPPTRDLDEDGYSDRTSDQRMLIVYRNNTMVVDFIGITGENGAGHSDHMDSLVISNGYFRYYRTAAKGKAYDYEDYAANRQLLKSGLTPYTTAGLSKTGYIEFSPKVDLSFLSASNLPASYYLKRAAYYLQKNQVGLAFSDIQKGIEANGGVRTCEILYLLVAAYSQAGEYEKAIANISLALHCKRSAGEEDWENLVDNYRTRIGLYIRLGKFGEALTDYDTLVSISENKPAANIERAGFKMKYLGDYAGAKNDLLLVINAIPENHLDDRPQGWSEYADTYFSLAGAEYGAGDKTAAFRHWLKAEEFGYSQSSSEAPVRYFDSIIKGEPQVPGLYLARALAHFKRGPYLGWGEETKKVFANALSDINTAERMGMSDYRVNMYRASVLNQLKQYNAAMQQVDIAIAKNNTDPRCYLTRYDIRRNLGQTKWGDNADLDFSRYKTLLRSWKWERD